MHCIKLVDTREITREEWLSWRKKGIGGSDISSLLGLNPWRSPLALYYDKVSEDDETEAPEEEMEEDTVDVEQAEPKDKSDNTDEEE